MSLAPAHAEDVTASEPKARRSRGKALLVDGEELVRMSTADMLIGLGFEVTEAGSAEEALRLVEGGKTPRPSRHRPPHAGYDRVDLGRTLREKRPGYPC